jgi:6-phosphogluconolactonase
MGFNNKKWCGMAFAMSNRVPNSVSAFLRDMCGALNFKEEISTGGNGTGEPIVDPLASQGSLVVGGHGRFLFAVNAGDGTVSSFRLEHGSVSLVSVVPSGGVKPVSIAVHENLVYVVNAGRGALAANLSGFFVNHIGELTPISGSNTPLGAASSLPACAVFSPDGRFLVVSLRGLDQLLTFRVMPGGLLSDSVITVSSGDGPFGMAFTQHGVLLVSEVGPNALSSYRILDDDALEVISASIPTNQGATCWVAVTPDGLWAYTANAGTGTISLFRVGRDGMLTLIESVPTTPSMNGAPIDLAIDPCGDFLYVLNGAQGSISAFRIECDGHPVLVQIFEDTSLPDVGAQGMAVS